MSDAPKNRDDRYFALLREMGMLLHRCWQGVKYKPLFGGVFHGREYCLASLFHSDTGLWEVTYYVVDIQSRFPLSCRATKADALADARLLLEESRSRVWSEIAGMARDIEARDAELEQQHQQWLSQMRSKGSERAKAIPRRRRQIFEESDGKCHYCDTPLTLDGKWHIEHKMPRALGGGNEPSNLVAACVPCNMKKKDSTDVEFKARMGKEAQ